MAGGIPEDFYVEQTICAGCGRPTVRIGVPLVDAMRSGGKESVLSGTCLMAMKVRQEKTRGQEAEGLPD